MTIVSDLELFNVSGVRETHPLCVDLTEWFACAYRYPPCEGFKLLPLCESDCLLVEGPYMLTCVDILAEAYHEYDFPLEALSLLSSYRCRNLDSYYENNFNTSYFTGTNSCYTTLPDPSG